VLAPLQFGPAAALEYQSILVPVVSGPEGHEAIDLAARLAAERGSTIVALRVLVVPLEQPLDSPMAVEEAEADRLLDDARLAASAYGVRTIDRMVQARNAGRAIVEEAQRRQSEIVVLGAPRLRHRAIFGKTVDYVLKNAPCRVMVAAGKKAA
jgi:nucleotide-binding universal stress UspA family protein